MNVLNKLTIRNMKVHRKRTVITIISVILTCILILSIGLLGSTWRESEIQKVEETVGSYHSHFQGYRYSQHLIIKQNKQVKDILTMMIESHIEEDIEYHGISSPFVFDIKRGDFHYFDKVKLTQGRIPTQSNEIIVSDDFLESDLFHKNIGDTITLQDKTYIIVGSYHQLPSTLPYQKNQYEFWGIFMPQNENVDFYVYYQSYKGSLETSAEIARELGDTCTWDSMGTVCDHLINNEQLLALYGETVHFELVAIISLFVILACFILGFFGVLVIYNAFAISVMERKQMFGVFSSIGATPKQLMKSVFFEAFLVLLIGLPLGFLLSIGGFSLILFLMNTFMKTDFHLAIYPLFLLIPFIGCIITVLFSCLSPAQRAREISPMEAIRQNDDIKLKGKYLKTHPFIRKIFGVEGDIALKNIKRNKKKYRVTIVSLVISIILFIAFSTFVNFGFKLVEANFQLVDYDIYFSMNDDDQNKIESLEKEIENNKYVTSFISFEEKGKFITNEINSTILVPDFYNQYIAEGGKYSDVSNFSFQYLTVLIMDDDGFEEYQKEVHVTGNYPLLVNHLELSFTTDGIDREPITVQYQGPIFQDNANITLETEDLYFNLEESHDLIQYHPMTITPVMVDTPPMGYARMNSFSLLMVIPRSQAEQYFVPYENHPLDLDHNKNIFIKTSDWQKFEKSFYNGRDPENMGIHIFHADNVAQTLSDYYRQMFLIKIILYSFIIFIALVGIMNIFTTIHTSMHLRKKEFAMLRSVGMTPRGINRMIRFESLFLGIKALFYGILLSLGIIWLIFYIFNWGSQLFDHEHKNIFYFPTTYVVICIVVVMAIIFITMYYASKKARKENIVDILKQDIF